MPMLDQLVQTQNPRPGDLIQSLRPFTAGAVLNAPVLDLIALVEHVDPLVAKTAASAAIGAVKRLHTMQVAPATPQLDTLVSMEYNDAMGTAEVRQRAFQLCRLGVIAQLARLKAQRRELSTVQSSQESDLLSSSRRR
ncbi:hypothetical protein KXD40_009576 [Peronospora effusa]|uniref:Uncharacterized protein n=1 Tax=Peronospora effusa TaxID=542832 RepID=A0A3R7W9I2_9STRA|nr:hypothetical protein DD237_007405 [Peronospora effusa]UIZ23905.1 hypothetical protein KXD40_009576 [Peronospora effusa]